MALHLWIGFALAYLATTLSPGPNVLLVIRNSVRFGRSSAAMTILGNLLAQLLVVLLVACGVGAVIAALPPFFGSSRFSGKCILDLQEEVCRVPEAVSHPLDDFDLIVHTFQNR